MWVFKNGKSAKLLQNNRPIAIAIQNYIVYCYKLL